MSLSNVEYISLKRKRGLHNWGGVSSRETLDAELDELETRELEAGDLSEPELLHQNSYGEYYALQDFEE